MLTEFQIGITKAHSIIQRTFAFIVTTARRPMFAEKFFYDITNSGRYLAVPLSFLFITCIFFIFVQLIHAVLILLINMKIETIKAFWQKANAKTNISERILTILQMLIDIILDTLISILQFAAFIPGYVHTLHEFLFPSSEETNDTEINEHQQ